MPPLEGRFDVSPKEAVAIQRQLADRVRTEPLVGEVRTVAAVDVSVRGDRVRAAVAVVSLPDLEKIDEAAWEGAVAFPYVPGLLSFREVPAIIPALERLSVIPDVIMADGHGLAHPRRFGLACHLGVLLDRPTFGVAKSVLVGSFDRPASERGSTSPMLHREETVGVALRTRQNVTPVYVSVGHRLTLEDAVRLTLECTTRYRLPEPARLAHRISKNV